MRTVLKSIVALALLAALAWGLWLLFPGEEKKIRRQLRDLAELATFTGREGNLKRLANASAIAGHFAPDAEIAIHVPGIGSRTFNGRGEVQEVALAAMAQGFKVNVEFHDIIVKVAPDKLTATADLTATLNRNSDGNFGVQELRFELRKGDSGWLVERLKTVQTFR